MAITTQFDVPVATQDAPPANSPWRTGGQLYLPKAGDVPRQCPARVATSAEFGEHFYNGVYLPITWKPNWTFRLGLKFKALYCQSNNITVLFEDQETGRPYHIRPDTFRIMMEKSTWVYGVVVEDWTWEKSGRYISLRPTYIK